MTKEIGQLPGIQYYLTVTINDNIINDTNIQYLVIKEWIFNIIPTLEFQFVDDGNLTERTPLEDAEEIDIILARHSDDENPMELTFILDDYDVGVMGDNRKSIITITGHLKANDIFTLKNRSFSMRNSSDVLSQIASESKIPFSNPRNIIPSDNMTWLQVSLNNFDFIKHVLDRSYVSNDMTFFFATTDNKFIYTSLHREMEKQESQTAKFSIENFSREDSKPGDPIWFSSYAMTNYSGYFNKTNGYGFGYSFYDLEKENTNFFDKIEKFTDLSFRNKDLVGSVMKYNTSVDYIKSNVYGPKYFESLARNEFLKNNFFANSVILEINSLSQVSLMDTIAVDIPSLLDPEEINEVLSGPYLISGIQHEVSKNGIYRKKISLGRNGMNKSNHYENYEYKVEK